MKRLLICLLLFGVVGCGKSDQAQEQPSSETTQNKQQQSGKSEQARESSALDDGKKLTERVDEASGLEGTSDAVPPTEQPIAMTFKEIPAGTFMMGSPESETYSEDDEHQHKVTISSPFYMQTTEVTQGQWKAVMATEPWKGRNHVKEGANYPATYVSWNDAVAYCKKLSEKEGKTYRLPTEAEWEYACRAGTETRWSFGNDEKMVGDYAWYAHNAWSVGEKYAHQVGLKKPNAFGLYDMHGNVKEWCRDYYGEDYYKQSTEKDPTGPASSSFHVLRGGPWNNFYARNVRSAVRNSAVAIDSSHTFGFRLVRELD